MFQTQVMLKDCSQCQYGIITRWLYPFTLVLFVVRGDSASLTQQVWLIAVPVALAPSHHNGLLVIWTAPMSWAHLSVPTSLSYLKTREWYWVHRLFPPSPPRIIKHRFYSKYPYRITDLATATASHWRHYCIVPPVWTMDGQWTECKCTYCLKHPFPSIFFYNSLFSLQRLKPSASN